MTPQGSRPKSWSPNEKDTQFLMDQNNLLSKSATTDDPSFISGHQWQQKLVVIQIQTIQ